ncbi:hypothetical protein MNBD_GAMMA22-1181 [hydrothermal vent metagenome]|uniref:DUF11 domain-containing protein n=1 Tax=hydrothermal vent metagenome TaxID=652676 RepID=A0A3B1A956_9ZZZZ
MRIIVKVFILLLSSIFANQLFASSFFTLTTNDAANSGFNDPTPFTAIGGNNATTLGQARLNALQYAANQLSKKINSTVNIDLIVSFRSLGQGVLAQTGTGGYHHNFNGALLRDTYYHSALANKLAGMEINTQIYDMTINFGSSIGNAEWYFGFDGKPPGGNRNYDFVTVATHEILHGIGFSTAVDVVSGAKRNGLNDVYMLNLEQHNAVQANYSLMTNAGRATANISNQLHWIGAAVVAKANNSNGFQNGHAAMYAPSSLQPGSSVSHFSTSFSGPDQMMEPAYRFPNHDIGLAAQVLEDIGWGKLNSDPRSVDLSVEVTSANLNPARGTNETYFITVTNKSGANTATAIVVSNFLPANSSFISVSPASGATCDNSNVAQNRIVTCSLPSLPASGTAIFSVVVRINNAAGNIFSANVESVNPDPVIINNSTVNTVLVNNEKPPVFSTVAPQTIEEGKKLTLPISASDLDGDIPTLRLLNLPATATFVSNGNGNATFTWTPATADVGNTVLNFEASDGKTPAVTMAVSVTVTAKPVPTPTPTPTPNPSTPPPPTSGADTPAAGCTLSRSAKFDPAFPVLLLFLSLVYFVRKKKLKI